MLALQAALVTLVVMWTAFETAPQLTRLVAFASRGTRNAYMSAGGFPSVKTMPGYACSLSVNVTDPAVCGMGFCPFESR